MIKRINDFTVHGGIPMQIASPEQSLALLRPSHRVAQGIFFVFSEGVR